jgi:inosine-uridine nucleoside N-ribohydrolase
MLPRCGRAIMPTPLLIDTDMGLDDAVALTWALSANETVDVVGVTSVEGNVSLSQATINIARLLGALQVPDWPLIGEGLCQSSGPRMDATHIFGQDGLGEADLPVPDDYRPAGYRKVYEQLIETHGRELVILAIGPLSNLAAILRETPELLGQAGRIIVMGGALWCKGNVNGQAEFNFYRDPVAAARVLGSGLPVSLVPLDVTRQVMLDASHVAHLSRSGTQGGALLARLMQFPLERDVDGGAGQFQVHDATALGTLLRPDLFLRAAMNVDVFTDGDEAGGCRPQVVRDKSKKVNVVVSVNVTDLLEKMIEALCHEKFVV